MAHGSEISELLGPAAGGPSSPAGAAAALDAAGRKAADDGTLGTDPGTMPARPGESAPPPPPKKKEKRHRRGPRSRSELKIELKAAEERNRLLEAERASLLPPEDETIAQLAGNLAMVVGVLGVYLARTVGEEFRFTEEEGKAIGGALAVPMAPLMPRVAGAMPWVGAALVVASIVIPKVEKHLAAKRAGDVPITGAPAGPEAPAGTGERLAQA